VPNKGGSTRRTGGDMKRRVMGYDQSASNYGNLFVYFMILLVIRRVPLNAPLTAVGFSRAVNSAQERTMNLFNCFARLLRDDSGATAIEYGLIAALIAVAAVVVMGTVGSNLTSVFTTVAADL
jgi:pilus assembly protein Flp/PilA